MAKRFKLNTKKKRTKDESLAQVLTCFGRTILTNIPTPCILTHARSTIIVKPIKHTIMSKYLQLKEKARQIAIDWQMEESERCSSWGEYAEAGNYFYKLGKRFGLLREFRENAIPC